jgi:hypothetical protein
LQRVECVPPALSCLNVKQPITLLSSRNRERWRRDPELRKAAQTSILATQITPELYDITPGKERAQGMPGARCACSLACE